MSYNFQSRKQILTLRGVYEFKFPKWEANFDAGRGIYVASIAWSWKNEIKWSLSTGQEIHQISNWNSLNVEHQAGVIAINVALVALYSGRQLAWLNVGFALHILPMRRKLAAMQRALSLLNSLRTRPRGWQARGWRVWGCAGSAGQHSVVGWAGMRPVLLLLSIAEVWAVLRGKLINNIDKLFSQTR